MAERLDMFMARANGLYYATHDPFADFTTAPEIAQMFGELIGAWAAVVWQAMGAPDPVLLVEAGPGRGTLMADALRATLRVAADFHAAARVHLIETSQRLRAEQAARIAGASWHDAAERLPEGPAIVIANEFLDALPIRQFERATDGWRERYVQDGRFVLRPFAGVPDGAAPAPGVIEIADAARAWVSALSHRLARQGGAALILDYGPASGGAGDSLQAISRGKPADPLRDAGSADLTAHVDFAALRRVAESAGAKAWGPVAQGAFLGPLGLQARTARLIAANPDQAGALAEAADRLANPARMGGLFKALCLTCPDQPAPPGFS